jgi:hypothetical protein
MKFVIFVKNKEMVNGHNVLAKYVANGFINIAINTFKIQKLFLLIIKHYIFVHFVEEIKNVK